MKIKHPLLPKYLRLMIGFGENLKLARLRRRLSAAIVAQRAGISRTTLNKVENGAPSVAMGNYLMVLNVLGLAQDFERLAADDEFGRRLQDLNLRPKKRAPKRSPAS
jgi:transcriptional regulator with XRE-family HTH domain